MCTLHSRCLTKIENIYERRGIYEIFNKKNTIENEGSQQSGMCKTRGRVKYKPPINRIIIYGSSDISSDATVM